MVTGWALVQSFLGSELFRIPELTFVIDERHYMIQSYVKRGSSRVQRVMLAVPILLGFATGCGSDDPKAGYYLRGRVFDGASQDPVAKAELTLISGQSTQRVVSAEDGTYKVGPIEPSATYRLMAKAGGMENFEFTGMALPALDVAGPQTRTLIGDVPMFEDSEKTPSFKISVASSDARLPVTIASVDFVPAIAGTDPSTVAAAAVPGTGTVIGAYAQPMAASLPNQAMVDARAFHAVVKNGEVEIPEDVLTWGATYNVRVDAGPDFSTLVFMHTPVHAGDIEIVIETAGTPFSNQLPQNVQQYFTGRIYDGVSLARLTNYTMRLEYFDRVLDATVDADGRYVVGPLLPNADFTIVVDSEGYRNFLSHNQKLPISGSGSVSALYYDAFMYPENVRAPATNVRFTISDDTKLPSGTVRFAPRSGSSLFNDDAETPAGVNRQVWTNDEDLQHRAIVRDFTDGQLAMAEGDFVLGVEYAVTVYGVANHAIMTNGTFRAGIDVNPSFKLEPVTEAPLEVVSVSNDNAALSPAGTIEIRFNHPVVEYPRMDKQLALRAMNDAFSMTSADKDEDGDFNVLVDAADLMDPVAPNYRGVTWEISGNLLTLRWDRERGLAESDTGDPIQSVAFSGLDSLWLYTGTLPTSPASSLEDLVGQMTLVQQMTAN